MQAPQKESMNLNDTDKTQLVTLEEETIPYTPWYKNGLMVCLLAFLAAVVSTIAFVASR